MDQNWFDDAGDILSQWASNQRHFVLLHGLSSGKAQFFIANAGDSVFSSGASSQSLTIGRWHFVAGSYDGSTVSVFVDGKLGNSANHTTTVRTNSTQDVLFGASADDHFLGGLGGARIYQKALNASEMLALYDQSQRYYPDLLNRRTRRTTVYVPAAGGSQYSDIFSSTIFGGSVIT